jgi:hypothetical protein
MLCLIVLSRVTSHYVIDQSMINIYDKKKKMFGGEAMQNPRVLGFYIDYKTCIISFQIMLLEYLEQNFLKDR